MKLSDMLWLSLMSAVIARDWCEDWNEYSCGDICVSQDCHCAQEIIKDLDLEFYCCVPPSDQRLCYKDSDDGPGYCPHPAKKKRISEKCNGECFNEYQQYSNSSLGERSHYQCEDGQCVKVGWVEKIAS